MSETNIGHQLYLNFLKSRGERTGKNEYIYLSIFNVSLCCYCCQMDKGHAPRVADQTAPLLNLILGLSPWGAHKRVV